jgi:hypothetical protein
MVVENQTTVPQAFGYYLQIYTLFKKIQLKTVEPLFCKMNKYCQSYIHPP